jgi:serine/threonine-protein kinase
VGPRTRHAAGCDAGTPLPRELGLYIAADVCRALAYAHSKTDGTRPLGIVHRDISPHNVLLSEQGEIKLTDFGIAKAMNKREQTGTGVVKGKVAFMSPEQAYGKPIDQRSDLFSLGTVLYLLMVRARPFEGPTDLETLLRVQKGDFLPPEAAAPDLEPEVAAIINRALKHDVNERYQTADEMLADLEHVLRTVFRPVGQTELKRWLTELSVHDGLPSILKGGGRQAISRTGTGELDGKDVVLSDSQEAVRRRDRRRGADLAGRRRGGGRRTRPDVPAAAGGEHGLELPVPRDAEADLNGRPSEELTALPISETEERPGRRVRSGGGFFKLLFVGGLLVLGAWAGGKYWRTSRRGWPATPIRPEPARARPPARMWVKPSRPKSRSRPRSPPLSPPRNRPRARADRGAPPRRRPGKRTRSKSAKSGWTTRMTARATSPRPRGAFARRP